MRLWDRFNRLSLWNKIGVIGSLASVVGLALPGIALVLATGRSSHPTDPQSTVRHSDAAPNDTLQAAIPSVKEAPVKLQREEARIGSEAENFSPITIEEFFSRMYVTSATSLQIDEFEKQMLGKTVIWTGRINSIEPGHDNTVRVTVIPPSGQYGTAFLDFDLSQRQEFLGLKKGQLIQLTGIIRNFVASPFLKNCRLLSILD